MTSKLDVFLTIDVEVWCDGWNDIDARFPAAFRSYVYGPTSQGHYALPHILKVLDTYGLTGVFFVEPLFAARFGIAPLCEIVGLLRDAGQELQLHLHTEWVDEAAEPLLEHVTHKRQHLHQYSLEEQSLLIEHGLALLARAGAHNVNAFRAGSFALNSDTFEALRRNHIQFDSSCNASMPNVNGCVGSAEFDSFEINGVFEYPMTVFRQPGGALRHTQLGACSYAELEYLLWSALESGRRSFLILLHNFELLNQAKNRPDEIVVSRFQRLCSFLDQYRDSFNVRTFDGMEPNTCTMPMKPITSPWWHTGRRVMEQAYRKRYG
jgi:hypothetical protein